MREPEIIGRCSLCNGVVVKEGVLVWCTNCGAEPKTPIIEMDPSSSFESRQQLLNEKNIDDQCE